ncbi:winged helix-turn-helix transcriptional regulator [Candidatus Dependentiae bacterium]|nr:winged helix-turn-helix transcriptional regulator [Candidatus Dependentiae bacterium]
MTKPKLKLQESRILKTLLEHNYYLSTTEISDKSNVSWNTADKYLKIFQKKEWIRKKKRGNRVYWRANIA